MYYFKKNIKNRSISKVIVPTMKIDFKLGDFVQPTVCS